MRPTKEALTGLDRPLSLGPSLELKNHLILASLTRNRAGPEEGGEDANDGSQKDAVPNKFNKSVPDPICRELWSSVRGVERNAGRGESHHADPRPLTPPSSGSTTSSAPRVDSVSSSQRVPSSLRKEVSGQTRLESGRTSRSPSGRRSRMPSTRRKVSPHEPFWRVEGRDRGGDGQPGGALTWNPLACVRFRQASSSGQSSSVRSCSL